VILVVVAIAQELRGVLWKEKQVDDMIEPLLRKWSRIQRAEEPIGLNNASQLDDMFEVCFCE